MNEQDILNFKNSIKDLSLEELEAKFAEVQDGISKMLLNSDLMIKAALLDSLIEERKAN